MDFSLFFPVANAFFRVGIFRMQPVLRHDVDQRTGVTRVRRSALCAFTAPSSSIPVCRAHSVLSNRHTPPYTIDPRQTRSPSAARISAQLAENTNDPSDTS